MDGVPADYLDRCVSNAFQGWKQRYSHGNSARSFARTNHLSDPARYGTLSCCRDSCGIRSRQVRSEFGLPIALGRMSGGRGAHDFDLSSDKRHLIGFQCENAIVSTRGFYWLSLGFLKRH